MVLFLGEKYASKIQSKIQHSKLLQTGQPVQLWDEGFGLLGKEGREEVGWLAQGRSRYSLLPKWDPQGYYLLQ